MKPNRTAAGSTFTTGSADRALSHPDVWVTGLLLGLALAVVMRPILVGLCLIPAQLARNERSFVLFVGLKGAVPILLGELLRAAHVPDAERFFGIVVVVVVFSVLVQGGLVPSVAVLLLLPMRSVEPEPWALGARLREEPGGVHRLHVEDGSSAQGQTIEELTRGIGEIWVSIVVRDSQLVATRADTRLMAADDVVVLSDPDLHATLAEAFGNPR